MTSVRAALLAVATGGLLALPVSPGAAAPSPAAATPGAIAAKTRGMRHMAGLLTLHWDAKAGKLYLEIPHLDEDLLYSDSLPYGAGSNDLFLDRGQMAESTKLVRFERFGTKILLVQKNTQFRVSSNDPDAKLAVRQSFPESVLAGFTVEAEDDAAPDRAAAVLVDATTFFQRDAHHVAETLALQQKDSYKLDPERSSLDLDTTRAFPKNIEVDTLLTFVADTLAPGGYVRDVAPDPHALSVRERQSFIELPGPGFVPRRYDPRSGYFPMGYRDYAVPLGASLDQRLIVRHRLLKQDPACTRACAAAQPIQYYVDRGAPEPIRSALVDGARWWDEAFQAAGWAPGTFRVDLLPEGADAMDVRYNIIQWVHRYTRGWSYGDEIADPRTGEIIKGNVTLGSLRGRQDYLIAEALLSPYGPGGSTAAADGNVAARDPMRELVLARLRQLSAHETGHTLGLAHNFAASAYPHEAQQTMSVMDYPHPWITLGTDGAPDVSAAYGVGIGAWDKVAIDYGYRQFAATDLPAGSAATGVDAEAPALDHILRAAADAGMEYITDDDARPLGGAHPHAHLWDNGADPADELLRIMTVRAAALARFGANAVKPGTPIAQLADTLVPLYLLHRYQTEAAIKEIGGLDYRYQLRGDGQAAAQIVAAGAQRKALKIVLRTLNPEFLGLPGPLLALLPPRPPGFERTRESFPSHTGLTFDPVAAAECAADLTLKALFDPARAARLMQYHVRDPTVPDLSAVIDATLSAVRVKTGAGPAATQTRAEPPLAAMIGDAVYVRTVEALLALAADPRAASGVRAVVAVKLADVKAGVLAAKRAPSPVAVFVAQRIGEFERAPEKFAAAPEVPAPPGMPIGSQEE